MPAGIISSLLDAFYGSLHTEPESRRLEEPFCQCCAQPFEGRAEHTRFCFNCRGIRWKFRRARAAFRMEGDVRELIHEFKYRSLHWLRRLLGEWIFQAYLEHFPQAHHSALVPVPLSAGRLKKRGFNQAGELASYLSKKIHIPVCDCIYRKKDVECQAGLTRSMRIRNVSGVFDIREEFARLKGDYLLIDDVLTTGSTASACAGVLLRNGAAAVDVLTVARA